MRRLEDIIAHKLRHSFARNLVDADTPQPRPRPTSIGLAVGLGIIVLANIM